MRPSACQGKVWRTSERIADAHGELLCRKAEECGERDDGRDAEAEDDGRRLVRQVEGPRDGHEEQEDVEPRVAQRVDEALAERGVLADGFLGLEEGLAQERGARRGLLRLLPRTRRSDGTRRAGGSMAERRVDRADLGRATLDLVDRLVVELGGRLVPAVVLAVEVGERRRAHLAATGRRRRRWRVVVVDGGRRGEGLEESGPESRVVQLGSRSRGCGCRGGVVEGRVLALLLIMGVGEGRKLGRVGMATYSWFVGRGNLESFSHASSRE